MKRNRALLIKRTIFIVILALVIMSIIIYSEQGKTFLQSHQLLPQREAFTELYFENASNLPKNISVTTPLTFSYTIHNLEYKPMNYPIEVSIVTDRIKRVIDKKNVSLPHNGYTTVMETSFIPPSDTKSEIIIQLPTKKLQIDFYLGGGLNGK